ncbi:ATP-binding protein [Domibacillus sp. A3M-37]|uniref:ATP-binding protein n=1 Tax=Domibacillus sp. A3M-37 TaxID=2962037 RepID=UPI0020B80A8B|nr:ATP-binding protein [Domibacillus sp. A3M-37]MCP3765033.1 ATP-binding protein [Domibacillus sp. A3M-37]
MNTTFETFQVLLLHILLVLTFFFIFVYFIQSKWNQLMNGFLSVLVSGCAIILFMTFPIITPGHAVDFRQIPFIIGALYGGRRGAFVLFSIIITYRLYLGYPDFQGFFLAYSSLLIVLWFVIPFFHKAVTIKKKVYFVLLVSFLAVLMIVFTFSLSFPALTNIRYLASAFIFFLVQSIVLSFIVIFIENSKIKKNLTKEIRKLEKLRTVSDIAASISHEVRNPLTVTRGFIQLLDDDHLTNEQKKFYISISLEELDRAESIINDYLTFAKPSLENIKIIDLKKELTYALKVVKPFAAMSNVCIEVQYDADLYIAGEEQKFHQCVINLTKNAIEAMPEGGKLTIALQALDGKAVITLSDTGVGMTNEQIDRLGTPYFSTKEKGTGLGTMVIFSLVKAMQGEIKVDSKVGKGTRFTILFPTVEHL